MAHRTRRAGCAVTAAGGLAFALIGDHLIDHKSHDDKQNETDDDRSQIVSEPGHLRVPFGSFFSPSFYHTN